MIKRLFNSRSATITGAAVLLGMASLTSRFLGVLRDRALAHTFGAGEMLDAYFTAFRIPDLVYNLLIAGALTAGFIPLFTELFVKNKEEAWKFTNNVLSILGVVVVLLSAVLVIFATPLAQFIAPGFSVDQQHLTAQLTRILFLSPLILGFSAIISGVLQSLRYFLVYSLSPIVYNVGIIIGALVFSRWWGIHGVAIGVILGAILHLCIQIPTALHAGFRPKIKFVWDKTLRKLLLIMVPRTLSLATYQIVLLILTVIATTLASGSVAIFNFANNIQFFPIGIFGISFALAAFPILSKTAAQGEISAFIEILSATVRKILLLVAPIMILFLLLRTEIVRIVLGSGEFDWTDTVRTADSLAFFSIGLFAQALLPLLSRGFWALKDSRTPFVASLIGAAVTIVGSFWLVPMFEQGSPVPGNGVLGLSAAFALGGIVNLILTWILLRIRVKTLHESRVVTSVVKFCLATIFMAPSVQITKSIIGELVDMQTFVGVLTKLILASVVGLIVYCVVALIVRSPEMLDLIKSFRKRWLKWTSVHEIETQEHL